MRAIAKLSLLRLRIAMFGLFLMGCAPGTGEAKDSDWVMGCAPGTGEAKDSDWVKNYSFVRAKGFKTEEAPTKVFTIDGVEWSRALHCYDPSDEKTPVWHARIERNDDKIIGLVCLSEDKDYWLGKSDFLRETRLAPEWAGWRSESNGGEGVTVVNSDFVGETSFVIGKPPPRGSKQ